LEDNLFLTEKLAKISCRKFIYISSIDVYPKSLKDSEESDDFLLSDVNAPYSQFKLIAETIVRKNCQNFLILRPSAMIGKDSRENSLIKILKNLPTKLTLSPDSSFNYILHDDVLSFIRRAVDQNLEGVFNLASSSNVDLQTVVKKYDNNNVEFGDFLYKTPQLNNNKAKSVSDVFNKSSLDNVEIFKKMTSF
jgi:nucleoside-diphosphate-sugar epimerase